MKSAFYFTHRFLLVLLGIFVFAAGAQAYPYDDSLDDLPNFLSLGGMETRTNGTVETYNIPIEDYPSAIKFTYIKGGDGGNAKTDPDVGQDFEADSGKGANIVVEFAIDPEANNALRPGGELRFVVGSKGERRFMGDAAAGGGGGGTAVLYRAPEAGAEWVILAVAGGGGGAASSAGAGDIYSRDGNDAETGTSGGDGRSNSNSGGENGDWGGGYIRTNMSAGGGGGALIQSSSDLTGRAGGTEGGAGGFSGSRGADGGFGFGGGGAGDSQDAGLSHDADSMGGGGGGYSGGGAGNEGGGGGGGSFLHAWGVNGSITSPAASGVSNGLVEYSLVIPKFPTSLPGPTITVPGDDPLTYYNYETDVEPDVSAVDAYGNSLNVSYPTFPTGAGSEGTYQFGFVAVDQFGNITTLNRTVIVKTYNKPTFSILSTDVEVDENSGPANFYGFAYDFNANDSDQELYQYSVTNTNNALFSNQPKVDRSGRLWFTPTEDAYGSAEVTVVGIDNAADSINGYSDPVTFTLTVNRVYNPPTTPTLDNTSVLEEGSSTVGTVSSTEPFGEIISFGLSNVGDHPQFDIDPLSGELSFISIPDYESPGDANADNIYEITVTANGSDGSSSATFEIEVLDRNEAPTDFALSNTSVNEQIQTEVGVLSATDYHGIGADFTIVGGADQGAFSVDPNADTLSFINAPNYEAPLDADGDNVYEVTITAANIHGSVTETFNISVINLSEKPTDFVLSNTRIDENQTSVGFFSATDEFGGAVTFENTGGWDGAFFDVDEDTGELSFKSAPDYETPLDRDGNNRYRVKVKASSTTGTNEIQFDINVSNVYDAPNAPTLSTTEVEENTTYVGLVSAVGESGSTITYQLVGGGDNTLFMIDPETGELSFVSGPNYENPLDADGDNLYEIYVVASDGELDSLTAQFSIRVLDVNEAPIFYGLDAFNLSENETDVDSLQASDPEGSALTYSISGGDDAGFFTIHPTSGYLTFVAAPDYEAPQDVGANNRYTVDVAASDGELSSVISVTVLVQNIDDINVDYFRSHYGLNEDGSDDAVDWSGNGIANILYFAFGLGDPNETSVDRSRLPTFDTTSSLGDYAFSYLQPEGDDSLDITLLTTADLTNGFVDLNTLGNEYQPVETETESLGDGYERIIQHFDFVSGEGARFYRIEVEVSNPAVE